jgi:predicted GNAT family N-acyltransferase
MQFEWITKFDKNQINEVHGLMQNEWWCKNRSLNDVNKIIETSDIVIGVLNEDSKVIGFARVLTDYIYKALIFDVIVEPSFRQSGLGKEIIQYLLNMPALSPVKSFELYCPERISGFYEKLGFVKSESKLLTFDR